MMLESTESIRHPAYDSNNNMMTYISDNVNVIIIGMIKWFDTENVNANEYQKHTNDKDYNQNAVMLTTKATVQQQNMISY